MFNNFKDFMGIPYKHEGRTREGLDCWGLVKIIYSENLGIEIPDIQDIGIANYPKNWAGKGNDYFIENYQKDWDRVDSPAAYDVILLSNNAGVANHAGVMIDQSRFIQCIRAGVVLSKLVDHKKRLGGFFRNKNVKI